jgi:hypothetical protein
MTATAENLIRVCTEAGIQLSRNGGKLRVAGKPGAITPELQLTLTEHKAELLTALNDDPRAVLMKLADANGINPELIQGLHDTDIASCADLPHDVLLSYLRLLRRSDMRRNRLVPAEETAMALCRSCGPVWIHPAVAAVAPLVNGWPRVLGCPWCHVRRAGGYVPRPSVQCVDCSNIVRDAVNPDGGVCNCAARRSPERPWPNANHECSAFDPSDAMSPAQQSS